MNPTLGLVALQSWYWVNGYDGQPFGASRTVTIPPAVPGGTPTSFTVTVRIWGDRYDWDFGDGSNASSHSLGSPYPQPSDITHTYQHSSLGLANGFPVRLTAEFRAEYSVNGGAPQPLPPIRHTYENDFRVQELQPVLTGT